MGELRLEEVGPSDTSVGPPKQAIDGRFPFLSFPSWSQRGQFCSVTPPHCDVLSHQKPKHSEMEPSRTETLKWRVKNKTFPH